MTPDLLALREWLQACGVTHVALESTGVYWKPVYYVLEDAYTLLLINIHTLQHVPGRSRARRIQPSWPTWRGAVTAEAGGVADGAAGLPSGACVSLEQILAKIDFLDETLERLTEELNRRLIPFAAVLTRLDTIPGLDRVGAISVLAEKGPRHDPVPTAAHVCSWAAMCPGNNQSAGKRRSGQTRDADPGGAGAMRTKGSALQARYHRIRRHRGHKKAVVEWRLDFEEAVLPALRITTMLRGEPSLAVEGAKDVVLAIESSRRDLP